MAPGNRGFRESLMKELLAGHEGRDYSGFLYCAPTSLMIRGFRADFHRHAGGCYIPPRSLSIRQLAARLFQTWEDRTIIPRHLAPVLISGLVGSGMGLSSIVCGFISEIQGHFPGASPIEVMRSLEEACLDAEIPEEVSRRILDAAEMFARYGETLEARKAVPEDGIMPRAAELIRARLEINTLMLDGFYEVTPAEELLIRGLIEKAEHTVVTIPISGNDDDLTFCYSNGLRRQFGVEPVLIASKSPPPALEVYPARSMEDEVESIAGNIKSNYITGKFRELDRVLLAFPRLDPYRDVVKRVFDRYGIPCSFSVARPLSATRPYRDLLSLLEAVSSDYPRLVFGRFLASPFFDNIPSALRAMVPRACLDGGLVKGKEAWRRIFRSHKVGKEGGWVFKVLSPLEIVNNKASYADIIKVILDVMGVFRFNPSGPSDEGISEVEGVMRSLSHVDGILGTGTSLSGFAEALSRVLDFKSEESEASGVVVSELREIRGLEPDYLYMGGLKDGDIPSKPDMDLLMPESVRKRLGLLDMDRHLRLQEHIFKRITAASGRVRLSYPSMEEDKFYLPSVFLSGAKEKQERLFALFSPEEDMLRRGKVPLSEHIREIEGLRGSFSDSAAINVTYVDGYRSCPRRFFIEKRLNLTPPELTEYEMEAQTLGTVIHEVMERLIPLPAADLEAFRANALRVLDEMMLDIPLDGYFKTLLRETFLEAVPAIFSLEEQMRAEGYVFHRAEHKVRGEPVTGEVGS